MDAITQLKSQPLVLPETLEDCHAVIKNYHQVIQNLCSLLEQQIAKSEQLCVRIEKLEAENKELYSRLNLNSSNSSKPPSSDKKKRKKKKRPSSGKPSGGQPGHPGHHRPLLDTSEVDEVVFCEVANTCEDCGGDVKKTGDILRHQVHELPHIKLDVTEYQLEKGRCCACGHRQLGVLPEDITFGITGPRLTSFMSMLVSDYKVSRRQVVKFLKTYCQFDLSLGSVFNKQRLVNQALSAPVNELLDEVKKGPCNVDETGHRQNGKTHWMWTVASTSAVYFKIFSSRGKKVIRELLSDYQHIVTSDRYAAYNIFDSSQRQLCWAHLKRDFTRLSERKIRVVSRIGKELLDLESQLFSHWHEYKRSEITREELLRQTQSLRRAIGHCLEKGSHLAPQLRIARFCKNLLENFHALWTFLEVEGIEPTNNHAERCLRPSVIWRKSYFCTHSDEGSEFVSRTASMLMTCQLQSKNAYDYLTQAVKNQFNGLPAPPLMTCNNS